MDERFGNESVFLTFFLKIDSKNLSQNPTKIQSKMRLITPLILLCFLFAVSAQEPGFNVNEGKIENNFIDTSAFRFNSTLTSPGSSHTFSINWDITNQGAEDEEIDIVLTLSGPGISTSYMAVGLGSSMLKVKEIFVCHLYPDSSVKIHEHKSNKNYAPPPKFEGAWVIKPIAGSFSELPDGAGSAFSCHFSRPTKPRDGRHMDIDLSDQEMIWSFNPAAKDGSFSVHLPNDRGNLMTILSSGLMISTGI